MSANNIDNPKRHTEDVITSQIPGHIVESYPFFVQFLKGYYEWLSKEGNPYAALKYHLDYLNFERSMNEYVAFMKEEFLTKIPQEVVGDKKFFIEWSRKLNLARGSHESYKFLFRMLFGESTTEIYLPKENILRTSDGVWTYNQSVMLVTNSGNPEKFLYKRIKQEREIFPGIFERAEATVDAYLIRYSSGFNVIELVLTDIVGEFQEGYLIYDDDGNTEWPIPTITSFEIEDGGTNYFVSEKLSFDSWTPHYEATYRVTEEGRLDTRLTTLLQKDQFTVTVDGTPIQLGDYEYDGRYLLSEQFTLGREINFILTNPYPGSIFVRRVSGSGVVEEIDITASPIAIQGSRIPMTSTDSFGTGLVAYAKVGITRPLYGYYIGQKGQLDANMYLQDSNYYQEYSYEIRTERNITEYADVVLNVLHPSGFKMFGNVRILNVIEAIIGIVESEVIVHGAKLLLDLALNSAGNNYLFIAKNQTFMSPRVYPDQEWVTNNYLEAIYEIDDKYLKGEPGYALEDESQERTFDLSGQPLTNIKKGWMAKQPLTDADILQPEDYFEHRLYDYLYMESSYINTANMDIPGWIDTHLDNYASYYYLEPDYVE